MNQNDWSSSNADNNQLISAYNFSTSSQNTEKYIQLKPRKFNQEPNSIYQSKTDKRSNFTMNHSQKSPNIYSSSQFS